MVRIGERGELVSSIVIVPWYATLFRGDRFEVALAEIAPVALRYGATEYDVLRSHEDTYKFLQITAMSEKADWEAYWYGDEFVRWRSEHHGWFQVPIVYEWHDRVVRGETRVEEAAEAG